MVIGKLIEQGQLSYQEIYDISAQALSKIPLTDRRVLVIIPDHTRQAPIDLFFKVIFDIIGRQVRTLDYLIALGTHPPMSEERILDLVGITAEDHKQKYAKVRFFNHIHNNPEELSVIGEIPADEIFRISKGLLQEELKITVNKHIFDYDLLIILGSIVPHESVGFSGGNKCFFPGIAGAEIIHFLHWLGAVITNPVINGVKHTPVRKLLDRAAAFIDVERLCFSFVVNGDGLACLFIGPPEESWEKAVDLSAKYHIVYKDKPYRRVLGVAPGRYEDLWVGGKVMYKLETVVADGGELIIYAPHIRDISFIHGRIIQQVGYHVRNYFIGQWERFSSIPRLILAHSSNVKGIGNFENGIESPRINVTLATGISREICQQVNLGYMDPRSVDLSRWGDREGDGILLVENAGEILYRLKNFLIK
ncbi:MAG: lactate racemase domain-containing protein [Fidelibacterota bacterium]